MKQLWLLSLILLLLTVNGFSHQTKKIDDWDVNATAKKRLERQMLKGAGVGGNIAPAIAMAAPMPAPMKRMAAPKPKKIGLAVGGAKDSDNFIENIQQGYLPKVDAITYEGVFYQHYFDTGLQQECHALFCPSYTSSVQKDLFTDKTHYYLSVGLNSGIEMNAFKRKKLNLVVVLDISGSMGASFNNYYYDGKRARGEHKSKMEIANEAIVAMMEHLTPKDSFGVVLFDDMAYPAKPLRKVAYTDMDAIKKHILELKEQGGTNWSAGYKMALKYFDKVQKRGYENRIIFITDAMPNRGELRKEGLFGLTKQAAKKGIHTTFIGVGVDFNTNLVEYVSKTRGANYYSVHSSKAFKKRMDKEFDYMVTPLVYDLSLQLNAKGYKIDAVYGSPQANLATGTIMKVNTLFPSASDGTRNKGGVILLRLKKTGKNNKLTLSVSYKDTNGKRFHNVQHVIFTKKTENTGIQKAILLSEYVTLMKNWIIDARAGCNDKVGYLRQPPMKIMQRCMIYPPIRPIYPKLKTWERRSCKLHISEGYYKLFALFRRHFIAQMKQLKDRSLNKELQVLERLLKTHKTPDGEAVIDDWHAYFVK